MNFPGPRPIQGFDPAAVTAILARVLTLPGGAELVTQSLSSIPGVIAVPARSGLFRATKPSVQLGVWRYTPGNAGRLLAAHVVERIALSEEQLAPAAAAAHLTASLRHHISEVGTHILPDVLAVLEGLEVAAG